MQNWTYNAERAKCSRALFISKKSKEQIFCEDLACDHALLVYFLCLSWEGSFFPLFFKKRKEKKNVASQARKDHMNYNEKLICFHL